MKTAVLISGQARTGRHTFANQFWMLLRHYPDPEFFVSLADDADAAAYREALLTRVPAERLHFEVVAQPQLPEPSGPVGPGHPSFHAPMAISSPVQGILRQLWHLQRVWAFAVASAPDLSTFGRYVRLRPDLWFHRYVCPFRPDHAVPMAGHLAFVPYWGGYGGVNDRFAELGFDAARAYFGTFTALDALLAAGCPLHPESLVAASLERASVLPLRELQAEFSALRPDGSLVWPDIQPYDLAALSNANPCL